MKICWKRRFLEANICDGTLVREEKLVSILVIRNYPVSDTSRYVKLEYLVCIGFPYQNLITGL